MNSIKISDQKDIEGIVDRITERFNYLSEQEKSETIKLLETRITTLKNQPEKNDFFSVQLSDLEKLNKALKVILYLKIN